MVDQGRTYVYVKTHVRTTWHHQYSFLSHLLLFLEEKNASNCINSLQPWKFYINPFLLSADFFKINFYEKNILEIQSDCHTVCIQIRPNILSGLIWVQSVCKGYQQTTLRRQ